MQEREQQIMQQFNSKYGPSPSSSQQFSKQFHHQHISLLSPNIIKSNQQDYYKAALLEIPIQKYLCNKQVYRFKVQKSENNYIMIGFCHIKEAVEKKYVDNYGKNSGSYVVFNRDGMINLHKDNEGRGREKDRVKRIGVGEVVELVYDPYEDSVEFRNIDKCQKDKIKVERVEDNPLHACVMLWDWGDEVQFLGMDLV